MVAVTLAHAIKHGKGWGAAAGAMLLFVLYALMPHIEAASERRRQKAEGSVTVDDWGVTRVSGDLREAIAWADVAWVRIYTTSNGPGADDVFFALGAGDGKGCLVSNALAVPARLMTALQQHFPGLDNTALVQAMGSTTDAVFTLWTRPGDQPNTAADKGTVS